MSLAAGFLPEKNSQPRNTLTAPVTVVALFLCMCSVRAGTFEYNVNFRFKNKQRELPSIETGGDEASFVFSLWGRREQVHPVLSVLFGFVGFGFQGLSQAW